MWWQAFVPGQALRVLLAVAALIAAFGAGVRVTDTTWKAREAEAARTANMTLLREVARGQDAQADLGLALQVQSAEYSNLERAFHDLQKRGIPTVVRASVAAAAAARPAEPGGTGPTPNAVAAPGCVIAFVDQAQPDHLVLSNGALWMWNSALAGADIPSGSCGLADPASPACAAETSVTVDDALANHAENARLCAEDRLRHQRLIDFLTGGKGR